MFRRTARSNTSTRISTRRRGASRSRPRCKRHERIRFMMKRDECFRALARHLGDEIVLPVYSSAFDWLEIAPRALNYYSFGAMGLGSSCALGFAPGRPAKRVSGLAG